jgi:hypothetical protein
MNIPTPSDEFRRHRPISDLPIDHPVHDAAEVGRDIEERSPAFWLPIAVAVVLLVGVIYYFFGSSFQLPSHRADTAAVTKSEPSKN